MGIIACGRDPHRTTGDASTSAEAPGLKQTLSQVKGSYTWRDDLARFQYSQKPRLEEILSTQRREEIVPVLVDCLDDSSPSQSVLDGKPVAVGMVCYEALTQLVYHEPTATGGDIATDWPGNISPRASAENMRAAKEAWRKVVADKSFVFQ